MVDLTPWVGLLKQVVLVVFCTFFTGVVLWTYAPGQRSLEDLRWLPFDETGGAVPGAEQPSREMLG